MGQRRTAIRTWAKAWAPAIGVVTGVTGALLGGVSWWQVTRTSVEATVAYRSSDYRVLDLSVVNRAHHATNLVGGEIRWRGFLVGRLVAVSTTDAVSSSVTAELVRSTGQPLPISIPPGQSLAGRLVWEGNRDALERRVARALTVKRVAGEPRLARDVEVRLAFDPGGTEIEQVELPFAWGDGELAEAPGWITQPCFDDTTREMRELRVFAVLPRPSVARLRLWRRDAAHAFRSLDRPVAGDRPTHFPLGRLAPGTYLWALTAEGLTVAAGDFRTPHPGENEQTAGRCVTAGVRHR